MSAPCCLSVRELIIGAAALFAGNVTAFDPLDRVHVGPK